MRRIALPMTTRPVPVHHFATFFRRIQNRWVMRRIFLKMSDSALMSESEAPSGNSKIRQFWKCAEEALVKAEAMQHPENRAQLLWIAASYMNMAEVLENIARKREAMAKS